MNIIEAVARACKGEHVYSDDGDMLRVSGRVVWISIADVNGRRSSLPASKRLLIDNFADDTWTVLK